jgi:hypothetical protein
MFTTGRIVFALTFLLIFAIGMIWAFRKDKKQYKGQYSKSYKIVLALLLILFVFFLIVKLRKYL